VVVLVGEVSVLEEADLLGATDDGEVVAGIGGEEEEAFTEAVVSTVVVEAFTEAVVSTVVVEAFTVEASTVLITFVTIPLIVIIKSK
jgi:hypothetical protein